MKRVAFNNNLVYLQTFFIGCYLKLNKLNTHTQNEFNTGNSDANNDYDIEAESIENVGKWKNKEKEK